MLYPEGTVKFEKDTLNREHVKIGKHSFTVMNKPDFFKWVEGRYGSVADFMKLKENDKEKT